MRFTLTQTVKILDEPGCLDKIGQLMKEEGFKKAFVVCDPGIVKLGISERAIKSIADQGLESVLYDKAQPDPSADIIDAGAEICKKMNCDCVIAIGGGSSLDVGKGINILRWNPGRILDYASPDAKMRLSTGLVSVPTTSGTGSELSNGLIVTNPLTGSKEPILAVEGMSEYAMLDAALTYGLPPQATAMTGIDVFSHACESYTSVLSNDLTDIICEKIMGDVAAYLPLAVRDGKNEEARRKMLALASLGGWMLACASAHVGHSFAHVLGAKYHIPHGLACSLSLPAVFGLLAEDETAKIRKVGAILGASFTGHEKPADIAEKTTSAFRQFCRAINLEQPVLPLPDGVGLQVLTDEIVKEPLAALCPKKINSQAIKPLLEEIFHTSNP